MPNIVRAGIYYLRFEWNALIIFSLRNSLRYFGGMPSNPMLAISSRRLSWLVSNEIWPRFDINAQNAVIVQISKRVRIAWISDWAAKNYSWSWGRGCGNWHENDWKLDAGNSRGPRNVNQESLDPWWITRWSNHHGKEFYNQTLLITCDKRIQWCKNTTMCILVPSWNSQPFAQASFNLINN